MDVYEDDNDGGMHSGDENDPPPLPLPPVEPAPFELVVRFEQQGGGNGGERVLSQGRVEPPRVRALDGAAVMATDNSAQASASQNDFQKPARPAVAAAAPVLPQNPAADAAEEEHDGTTCTICFEPWTHDGPHRIVSLRCGHLFGHSCIDRWLVSRRLCPMCKKAAALKDLRPIYTRNIVVVDSSERDRALELAERYRLEAEAAKAAEATSRLQATMNLTELQLARAELKTLRRQLELSQGRVDTTKGVATVAPPVTALERYLSGGGRVAAPAQPAAVNTFAWQRTVRVSADNQARVVDYDRTQEILVASGLRAGGRYGFSKVSLLDDRHVEFVAVHERPVRDIRCSPRPDGLVLTTSLDRQLRIVSTASNAVVQSYPLSSAGWSCCWDVANPHRILAGQQDGTVAVFDMRAGQQPVWRVAGLGDRRLAVHSLDTIAPSAAAAPAGAAAAAPADDGDDPDNDGNRLTLAVAEADPEGWPTIFAGTLENAFVIQPRPGDVNVTPCPVVDSGGACTFARWEPTQGAFLKGHRSADAQARTLCMMGSVGLAPPVPRFARVQEYGGCSGSSHMSRGDLAVSRCGGDGGVHKLTAFLPDEAQRRVIVYDVATRVVSGSFAVPTSGGLLHAKHFAVGRSEWAAVVTEADLLLYKLVT